MRLGTILELLLILLLVAFAAYGRVIERDEVNARSIRSVKQSNLGVSTLSLKQAADNVNRYCTCNENICNCCRDFHIPLVQLKGPGCASLQYLQGDNLAVQLSFGDNILTSTIVNGKSPKPVCVPLPGGFTKFCGRIYSIERDSKNHFKACLGLELQSSTELEASLRVSCFRFGPEGLKLRPAEPLPVVETEVQEEDDDDDFFGLGSDDDDDDDDEDDEEEESAALANSVPNSSAEDAEDADDEDDDDDDEDVLGLGALLDIITGDDESSTKKPKVTTAAPLLQFTIPILNKPSTESSLESVEVLDAGNNVPTGSEAEGEEHVEYAQEPEKVEEENNSDDEDHTESTEVLDSSEDLEDVVTEASNKINVFAKPAKVTTNKVKLTETKKKKPTLTSTSINAIDNEIKKKKPLKKPIKDETDDDDDLLGEDDLDDDDDDDDVLDDVDEDEKEEEDDEDDDDVDDDEDDDDEKEEDESHDDHKDNEDEKAEDIDDLDDDDDEEEDAMISALVYDEKEEGKKDKVKKNKATNVDEEESDYDLGLSGLLARKRHLRTGRQSRIMRL